MSTVGTAAGQKPSAAGNIIAILAQRRDLALVALLFGIVFLMIIPMPTWLVDTLLAVNIAISVTLLILGVYLKDPLEISTLPSIILVGVIFRLALSITTTRLILATGDPGQIVKTFGDFVVFGNLVVGLVIFLIITVVQFMVITKGAERVAEVAARFSLDGLPGKQMSIDSDLRAGLISVDEAQRRRQTLEKQMQFYGAMDGAMKFVKGDAIAGLIITTINLVGGLAIGTAQRGMSMNEALNLYALLTVGDGLVAQLPALMLSITAGAIITRVTTEKSDNLGADISMQLFAKPLVLRTAAGVLLIFAIIPGFPILIFLGLAAVMIIGAEYARRAEKRRSDEGDIDAIGLADEKASELDRLAPLPVVLMRLAPDLKDALSGAHVRARLDELRQAFFERMGVWCAPPVLRLDPALESRRYRIDVDGVRKVEGVIETDRLILADTARARLDLAGIAFEEIVAEGGRRYLATPKESAALLDKAAVKPLNVEEQLVDALLTTLQRSAASFVGVQETSVLMDGLERHYGELVKQALALCPIEKIAQVLQCLVKDGVSIRNLRAILNSLIEWAPQESDASLLAEYVRTHLKAQISQEHVSSIGVIPAYLIADEALERLRGVIHDSSQGSYLALDQTSTRRMLDVIKPLAAMNGDAGKPSVVLTPIDLRRLVQQFLRNNNVGVPVLSYQDISADVRLHCMGTLNF
jgi:type III secretion protein V